MHHPHRASLALPVSACVLAVCGALDSEPNVIVHSQLVSIYNTQTKPVKKIHRVERK
jgi:hypothetical protein